MNNMLALIILAVVVSLTVGFSAATALKYRRRWLLLRQTKENNLPVDLDLATSDQLIFELRKREIPYLLLRPAQDYETETFNLTMEVSGIGPTDAAGLLGVAAALSVQELKRRGAELPPHMSGEQSDEDEEE